MSRTSGQEETRLECAHLIGMVDSATTVLLLSAGLLAALGLASVGLVAASELTIRFRRFRAARAIRAQMPARQPR